MRKRPFLWFTIIISSILFVFLNFYFSQSFHPLFFRLVTQDNKNDAIEYLQKIKRQPSFPEELAFYKEKYGENIEQAVFAQELAVQENIERLKSILSQNPDSRDVLVELSLLHLDINNRLEAKNYYARAKQIDPALSILELESL